MTAIAGSKFYTSFSSAFSPGGPNDLRWEDLKVPLSTAKAPASDFPNHTTFKNGINAYSFGASANEYLNFETQLPHGWLAGSEIQPHIHWAPSSTSTGSVVWALEYTIASINGTYGASTIISGAFPGEGTAYKHQMSNFPVISLSGETMSCVMVGRLVRSGSHSLDTYVDGAFGLSFDIHYQTDGIGSHTIVTK